MPDISEFIPSEQPSGFLRDAAVCRVTGDPVTVEASNGKREQVNFQDIPDAELEQFITDEERSWADSEPNANLRKNMWYLVRAHARCEYWMYQQGLRAGIPSSLLDDCFKYRVSLLKNYAVGEECKCRLKSEEELRKDLTKAKVPPQKGQYERLERLTGPELGALLCRTFHERTADDRLKDEIFSRLREIERYGTPLPLRAWTEVLIWWAWKWPFRVASMIAADLKALGYAKEDADLLARHCVGTTQQIFYENGLIR